MYPYFSFGIGIQGFLADIFVFAIKSLNKKNLSKAKKLSRIGGPKYSKNIITQIS